MKNYKKYIFVMVIFLAMLSCKGIQEEKSYLIQSERIVDSIYFNTFNSPLELKKKPNPIDLYTSIEDYFVFNGVLQARDKEGYKSMYHQLLVNGSKIDLGCLYKHFPEVQWLTNVPSNVALHHYSFEQAVSTYKRQLPKESSMFKANTKLQKIVENGDINFDIQLMEDYINAIEASDFENKFIYRIPLLAYAHILISEH